MDLLLLVAVLLTIATLLFLVMQIVRLRLELWANRRVIAALEKTEAKPAGKAASRVPELLAWALLLLIVWQFLVSL